MTWLAIYLAIGVLFMGRPRFRYTEWAFGVIAWPGCAWIAFKTKFLGDP